MTNAKPYFIFTVLLYVILLVWGIKGPAPNDYWQFGWILQIIIFNVVAIITLFRVKSKLEEDPTHKKIISRLLLLYPVLSFITIWIVVGL